MTNQKLKENYKTAVFGYINAFCEKYEVEFEQYQNEDDFIFLFNDYYFDLIVVKYCIDNNVKSEYLFDWYDYSLEQENTNYNLKSYVKIRTDFEQKKGEKFDLKEFNLHLQSFGKTVVGVDLTTKIDNSKKQLEKIIANKL